MIVNCDNTKMKSLDWNRPIQDMGLTSHIRQEYKIDRDTLFLYPHGKWESSINHSSSVTVLFLLSKTFVHFRQHNIETFAANASINEDSKILEVRRKRLLVEKKLTRTSLMLLGVWLLSWTPYASVFVMNVSGYSHLVTHHIDMLPGPPSPSPNKHYLRFKYLYLPKHFKIHIFNFSCVCQTELCCQSHHLRTHVSP